MKNINRRAVVVVIVFQVFGFYAVAFRSKPGFLVHTAITNRAISNEFADRDTLRWIHQESRNVDKGAKFYDNALHFDSEAFIFGAERLADNLNLAMERLSQCDKAAAIVHIGEALHALQDFYSHSNWVENYLDGPNPVPSDIPIFDELIILGASGQFEEGWLTPDFTFTDTCTPSPGPPLGVITSGYSPDDTAPANKCPHEETNKDWRTNQFLDPWASPRGAFVINEKPLYDFAFDVARRHTQKLWQDFKQAFIVRYGPDLGRDYYNTLVKARAGGVGFVIDVTGSMANELPLVKQRVQDWVTFIEQNEIEIPSVTLVTFTDSIVFQGTTCSPNEFLGWVDDLTTGDGGDCPEASLTAALEAADRVGRKGSLILATDAPPRELEDTLEQLNAILSGRHITCHTIWDELCTPDHIAAQGGTGSGSTGLSSEVYREIAELSGGLSLPFSDFDQALELILEKITQNLEELARENGNLIRDSGGLPVPRILTVPVDNTVERIDFVLEGSSVYLLVYRPGGARVLQSDPDADLFFGPGLQRVRITDPAPGQWVMNISGDGLFQAYVLVNPGLSIFDVTFLRIQEADDDLLLISNVEGPLQLWETYGVEIDLIGDVSTVSFDLVGPDGSVIESLPTTADELGLGMFFGEYTPSSLISRFYVRASGTDTTGATFQRFFQTPFRISTDLVVDAEGPQVTSPGCEIPHTFEVYNFGEPDTFAVTAVSEHDFSISLSDTLLVLAKDEMAYVDVMVTVPKDTPAEQDDITLDVTSTTDATRNLATATTIIDSTYDCNCNGLSDVDDLFFGVSSDCNANGTPDECENVPEADPTGIDNSRFISFVPDDAGNQTAIRVKLVRMYIDNIEDPTNGCPPRTTQPDLSLFDGKVRWLGAPAEFNDNSLSMPNFIAASLECSPYYRDWSPAALATDFNGNGPGPTGNGIDGHPDLDGVLHVFGAEIVPCSVYEVQVILFDQACEVGNEASFSAPLSISTALWGDVWEPFENVTMTDVGKVVEAFKSVAYIPGSPEEGAPPKVRAMLRHNVPPVNGSISFTDISKVVDGFKTIPYKEDGPNPDTCQWTVACDTLPGCGQCCDDNTLCANDADCIDCCGGVCDDGETPCYTDADCTVCCGGVCGGRPNSCGPQDSLCTAPASCARDAAGNDPFVCRNKDKRCTAP